MHLVDRSRSWDGSEDRNRFHPSAGSGSVRKADIVLVALGLAALVLTGVAVAKSDAWTGERTYRYASVAAPLAAQGPSTAGSVPARFEWPAPDNSTGTGIEVAIAFSGQAVQGGAVIVRVSGVAPDGTQLPVQTRTFAVAQGATSGGIDFAYNASWATQPHKVRDIQAPSAWHWEKPLLVLVTVERPADVPAASYSFTAAVTGSFTVFAAS